MMGNNKVSVTFNSIKHLPGSKILDRKDKVLGNDMVPFFLDKIQFVNRDIITVSEKTDGSNVSILRANGKLCPVNRHGYDVRTSERGFLREFGRYVEQNERRFLEILKDGQKMTGEWMIRTHSIIYDLPCEPFIVFSIVNQNMYSENYVERKDKNDINIDNVSNLCDKIDIPFQNNIHVGGSISIESSLEKLGKGKFGAQPGPEGVVYRYERDGKLYAYAKYVNPGIIDSKYLDDNLFRLNTWQGDFKVSDGLCD